MRRIVWTVVAGGLAAVSMAGIALHFLGGPAVVRVAVARDTIDRQIVASVTKLLLRERADIRFRIVLKDSPAAAAKALESGTVDAAFVRTDLGLPSNGKAVALMRYSSALFVAPSGSKLSSVADLRGKRIGLVEGGPFGRLDGGLLKTILTQYDIPANDVAIVPLRLAEIPAALRMQRIDVLFSLGEPATGPLVDVVNLVAAATFAEPVFLSIGQAPAIAQMAPALTASKIVTGAFGGAKPRPQAMIDSLAVTTLLMADRKLDDALVNSVARAIFSFKTRIALETPAALRMEAPSTNKDAALTAHPGAAAFFNGEDVSLIYRYSDFIYLGAMVLSMIGSAIAAIVSRTNMGARRRLHELLNRLVELLGQVRLADNAPMLKLAQIEVDGILVEALSNGGKGLDADMTGALGLAIGQVREAIRDKQAELTSATSVSIDGSQSAKQKVARLAPAKTGRMRPAATRIRVA